MLLALQYTPLCYVCLKDTFYSQVLHGLLKSMKLAVTILFSEPGGTQKPDQYRSKSGRPLLQVVETCRSVVFVPNVVDAEKDFDVENPSGKLIVSEWRRRNGILDDNHSAPMNVEVDLPREAGFVSDASLLLAEKILAKVGHTGKFNRIGNNAKGTFMNANP